MRKTAVSFGGGVNSTALLVGLHERGQRPDLILFADTGGEKPETYKHLAIMRHWCLSNGFPEITVVRYHESKHASLEQECLNNGTLPSKAFGYAGCSVKWKRQPMDKFLHAWVERHEPSIRIYDDTSAKAPKLLGYSPRIERLIGLHFGEWKRGKIADTEHFVYRYPLREWEWEQADCQAACERAGIRVPVKSACFYCPANRKPEVLALAKTHPKLFARAVEMEHNAQECGGLQVVKGLGRHWTWEDLAAADAAQLRAFPDGQAPLCDACFDGD